MAVNMICTLCKGSGSLFCLDSSNKLEWWNCVCCGGDGVRANGINGKPIVISSSQTKMVKPIDIENLNNNILTFFIEDFSSELKLAHIMHKAKIFKSISDAKRNGWDKPIECGNFFFKKKNITVIVKSK